MKNEQGMTLVEVVAALAILSIILLGFGGALINNMIYTTATSQKLTTLQLANSVLKKYESKSYSDLASQLNQSDTLDANGLALLLNNDTTTANQFKGFTVKVDFSPPDDSSLSNYLIKIQVTATTTQNYIKNNTVLKGYVRQ